MVTLAEARPPYVKFVRRGVEDRTRTISEGRYVEKDVDFAIVTPQGSKDRLEFEAQPWLQNLAADVKSGRFPSKWLDGYREAYDAFKRGEEIPLDGTSVKQWAYPSPAQIRSLLDARLLTIEDVAQANDDALRICGPGSLALRQAAKDWLVQAKSTGKAVLEMQKVRQELATARVRLEGLEERAKLLELENIQLKAALGQPGAQTVVGTREPLQRPEDPDSVDISDDDLKEAAN